MWAMSGQLIRCGSLSLRTVCISGEKRRRKRSIEWNLFSGKSSRVRASRVSQTSQQPRCLGFDLASMTESSRERPVNVRWTPPERWCTTRKSIASPWLGAFTPPHSLIQSWRAEDHFCLFTTTCIAGSLHASLCLSFLFFSFSLSNYSRTSITLSQINARKALARDL